MTIAQSVNRMLAGLWGPTWPSLTSYISTSHAVVNGTLYGLWGTYWNIVMISQYQLRAKGFFV